MASKVFPFNVVRKPGLELPAVVKLRSRFTAGSAGAFKLTFAVLLIVAALGFTYTGSGGDFPSFELRGVLLRVIAFSGGLLAVALALPSTNAVSNVALALTTLAGVFTVYVVHTELFHPSNTVWMVSVLTASLFALITAFRVIEDLRWGGLALTAAAALAVVAAAWLEVGPGVLSGMSTPGGLLYVGRLSMWTVLAMVCIGSALTLYVLSRAIHPSRWGVIALLAAALFVGMLFLALEYRFGEGSNGYYADGWEDHPNVQSVAFKETPNIYFVGFDSITPDAVMSEYMGIEATDFHRVVEGEMRRFRNLFANAIPTTHSINTMMALDQDIYLENSGFYGLPNYFAGHDLSPLVWLLRENGYETTSIYQSTYFGHTQGPGIDKYAVNERRALCSLLDGGIRSWAFWGYCWGWEEGADTGRLPAGDFLVQQLSEVDRGNPQFVIAHLYFPGHTPKIFDYEDRRDRELFLESYERKFNRAATYLQQIIEHLRTNDPNSILFVFGDHGAWLSRGLDIEDAPTFVIQDRFGVLGGVYPRDRCAPELDEAERKDYVTSLDVVHAIIECLSGGQNPLLGPRHDRFWSSSIPQDHSYDYKEFLYE